MWAVWHGPSAALLIATAISDGGAQIRITLGAPTASPREEFSLVTGLRELADGRILVADGPELRVALLRFDGSQSESIRVLGNGPREVSSVGSLFRLGGDSSLLVDLAARRWLLLDGSRVARAMTSADAAIVSTRAFIESADRHGMVLSRAHSPPRIGRHTYSAADSTTLLLVSRSTGETVAIARLRRRPTVESITRLDSRGEPVEGSTRVVGVLTGEEAACLLADGTVMVARLDPFRVDIRSVQGVWSSGVVLPDSRVRVDASERRAFAARNRGVTIPEEQFPEYLPPFSRGTLDLLAVNSAGILIRRTRSSKVTGNLYFFVDRRGRFVGHLELPAKERVVAVTLTNLYTANENDDGLERVVRYPLPGVLREQ